MVGSRGPSPKKGQETLLGASGIKVRSVGNGLATRLQEIHGAVSWTRQNPRTFYKCQRKREDDILAFVADE
jgi:hypothetical protein